MFDLESAIIHAEKVYEEKLDERSYALEFHDNEEAEACQKCAEEHRQLAEWLKELAERRKQPEIIHCGECVYYDPPHVENNGIRYEYAEMPKEAFDVLGTGLVSVEYGINVGGRCCRDYNAGYSDDKRVYVPENNYCGRGERRTDGQDKTDS